MEGLRDLAALVGRILLALIFVLSGFSKIANFSGTAGMMAHAGLPGGLVVPLLYLSILVEFGGGLLIVLGLLARPAAFIIFLWLIPVTFIFHVAGHSQALQQHDMKGAMMQQIMFMKNFSMMGGLLMVAAFGAGRFSLDSRFSTVEGTGTRRAA